MLFASRGGKTKELLPIADICRKKGVSIITITENTGSELAACADVVLRQYVNRETDKYNSQGTTSTTSLIVLFHALQAAQGAQILCVCTNDSWFGKSYARQMHFRHSVMRAVENGRYLLRSGNCGISAVIKPTGEVQSIRTQTSKGVIADEARLIDECTLYSRSKDLFTVFPAALTAVAVMKMYRKSKKNNK